MKRLQTRISFQDYCSFFEGKEISKPEEWHLMLINAVAELRNEDVEQLMISVDWFIAANLFSGKKVGKSTIVVVKEYIKRVLNFEAEQAKLAEASQRAMREAYVKIQEERINRMNKIGVEPYFPESNQDKINKLNLYLKDLTIQFDEARDMGDVIEIKDLIARILNVKDELRILVTDAKYFYWDKPHKPEPWEY
jgi:hypothetical protein